MNRIVRHFKEDRATLQEAKDALTPRIERDVQIIARKICEVLTNQVGVMLFEEDTTRDYVDTLRMSDKARDILLMMITDRPIPNWLYLMRLEHAVKESEK